MFWINQKLKITFSFLLLPLAFNLVFVLIKGSLEFKHLLLSVDLLLSKLNCLNIFTDLSSYRILTIFILTVITDVFNTFWSFYKQSKEFLFFAFLHEPRPNQIAINELPFNVILSFAAILTLSLNYFVIYHLEVRQFKIFKITKLTNPITWLGEQNAILKLECV